MSDDNQPQPHLLRVLSTKPPHKQIRAEACTCSQGRDHYVYETP